MERFKFAVKVRGCGQPTGTSSEVRAGRTEVNRLVIVELALVQFLGSVGGLLAGGTLSLSGGRGVERVWWCSFLCWTSH